MQRVPLLVLGASVFGIAMALSRPQETLVVERGALLGPEWIASLNGCPHAGRSLCTEEARDFARELAQRGWLNARGAFHLPPISSALAHRLLASGARVRLLSEVVAIEPGDVDFEVTLYDADGFSRLRAGRIVDTTAEGVLHGLAGGHDRCKGLCAVLANFGGGPLDAWHDTRARLLRGALDGEWLLKFALAQHDDWRAARARLHDCWQQLRVEGLAGWRIAHVASVFAQDFAERGLCEQVCPGWSWRPSAAFSDLLDAFEGGMLCAANG